MSNKQAPRADKAPAAAAPTKTSATLAGLSSPRIRVSTGMMIGGGGVSAVASFLPWIALADGTTLAGVQTIAGLGNLVLGTIVFVVGVFILLRADHPKARAAAWLGLAAAMGIAAMGLFGVFQPGQYDGAKVEVGVLFAFAGGLVATMGVRGLLENR